MIVQVAQAVLIVAGLVLLAAAWNVPGALAVACAVVVVLLETRGGD